MDGQNHAKIASMDEELSIRFCIMKRKVFENAFVVDSDLSDDPLLIFNIVIAT